METETISVRTGDSTITDLTDRAAAFVDGRPDGLLNVFVPHATAGLALIETGAGSDADLEALLHEHLLPRDRPYRHAHGSAGHGADHVLPAIVSPSVTVPVVGGHLTLGIWQSLVLVDTNVDNPDRTVRFSFLD
ncbi:MAG: YjbQ family protein [Actinomycetota bacterium]